MCWRRCGPHKCNVGGEQSGHIILADYATSGDGIIAALQILRVLVQKQLKASHLGRIFNPVPQILRSIHTTTFAALHDAKVCKAIKEVEHQLGLEQGKLLIRQSGTEPLIRIMAQGDNEQTLTSLVHYIAETIETADRMAA